MGDMPILIPNRNVYLEFMVDPDPLCVYVLNAFAESLR